MNEHTNRQWRNEMKKIAILLCSVILSGWIMNSMVYVQPVYADERTVSGGDSEEQDSVSTGDSKGTLSALSRKELQTIIDEREVMALVYLADEYSVKKEASYNSETVVTVPSGQQVQIQGVEVDEYQQAWISVKLIYGGVEYYGYIPRTNLACSDERYLAWEEQYDIENAIPQITAFASNSNSVPADIAQFPKSYHAPLLKLKQEHPKWTFVKMNTKLDWNTVLDNELVGARSLVPNSFSASMKEGVYGQGWSYASRGALAYYMDPRNGITEDWIFQYEQLTYNETYHTEKALQAYLNNTFMNGGIPELDSNMTYTHVFWAIGKEQNVSPFHLASRVHQEQGQGNSPLISGEYEGYKGYYNYFNIGASGKTDTEVIRNGLETAKKQGWDNRYKSILGGAKFLAQNYIAVGQDTLYLQKFDVDDSDGKLYHHQYMQNICAPSSEGKNISKLYNDAKSINNTFVFKIPVYLNMPANACAKPTVSYSVSVTPPAGYEDNTIYLDGIPYKGTVINGKLVATAPNGKAQTATMYKYNKDGVAIGMYVWTLSHNGTQYAVKEVPGLADLLTYHGFSIRIVGRSGIRFKTGITTDMRYKLLTSGVGGYKLKEYGTLIMNNANRDQYQMIKGGEKVLSGLSYGYDAKGKLQDTIYENVNGRHRFTSVLVGLPAKQYKVEYAFRGYIVLTKDGKDITLYGPAVARSIYSLAEQVLASNQYQEGSSAEKFLKQLIIDADNVE